MICCKFKSVRNTNTKLTRFGVHHVYVIQDFLDESKQNP